ncbi:lipase member H-A-like isoform X1 [Nasonia vitripennis]|uniref:phospholipase A1 n=1 Tax=Nasonia vitripennis TaxID=7425 RepID=A0A7M7QBH7_NASVI|nr:lipase member H-A-like isoform X1 [Nasonia vitripennis]
MVGFCLLVPLLVLSVCGSNARRARIEDALQEIFFRLYSGDPEQYADARLYEVRNLVARMEPDKPTVFYLHGYTGSARSRDVLAVVSGYLERGDHNVIAVDWSPIAGKNYPSVVSSAKSVGEAVAGAIDEMVDQGLTSRSIHVVGHSMGAQVAGYAGRRTSFELSRITGLDPAGPFFNFLEAHLQASDASFVDTIHTDAGFYGINRASGAASFYPNGGRRVQPGCPSSYELSSPEGKFRFFILTFSLSLSMALFRRFLQRCAHVRVHDAFLVLCDSLVLFRPLADYCSHHRSWLFYAESLRKEDSFLATNCSSYRSFARGACDDAAKVPMGFATPGNARGVFFLTTKSEPPFGMQMDGAVSTSSRADRNINNADKKEASNSRETGTGAARAVEKNLIGRFIV